MRRAWAGVVALIAGAAAWGGAGASAIAAEPVRIAVERFTGPGAVRVRDAVVEAIGAQSRYEVLSPESAPGTRSSADYVSAARELGALAFVSGVVTGGDGSSVTISVRNGADGEELGSGTTFRAVKYPLPETLKRNFWRRVGVLIEAAKAPESAASSEETKAAAAPAPRRRWGRPEAQAQSARESDAEPSESAEGAGAARRPMALDLIVGSRVFSRSLKYVDSLSGSLRPYSLPFGAAPWLAVEIYPGAFASPGLAADLGLTASFERSVGLVSRAGAAEGGAEYPTSASSYSVGVRGRYRSGRSDAGLALSYGGQAFSIADASSTSPKPDIPDVSYRFLRMGAGGRLAVSAPAALLMQAAYRHVLSTGEIGGASYYPRATARGLDASAGLAYRLGNAGLEGRVALDIRRYGFAINPRPGDMAVAGGAVDQYVGLSLGIAYRREGAHE